MLQGYHLQDAKTLAICYGAGLAVFAFLKERGPIQNMACRRFCLGLARFGPWVCRCLFHYEVDFAQDAAKVLRREDPARQRQGSGESVNEMVVSDAAAFLMTLSSADLVNLLYEPHLGRFERWWKSGVTLTPDLWKLSELVEMFCKDTEVFSPMDDMCDDDPINCAYAFVCNCERPLRVATFLGCLGWLSRKCRVEVDGRVDMDHTLAACEAVSIVLVTCLAYIR